VAAWLRGPAGQNLRHGFGLWQSWKFFPAWLGIGLATNHSTFLEIQKGKKGQATAAASRQTGPNMHSGHHGRKCLNVNPKTSTLLALIKIASSSIIKDLRVFVRRRDLLPSVNDDGERLSFSKYNSSELASRD
jgi:hypothetical protein